MKLLGQLKKTVDAGRKVAIGGHGCPHGLSAHWDMRLLQMGGMTPMQVLRAATIVGVEKLGLQLAERFAPSIYTLRWSYHWHPTTTSETDQKEEISRKLHGDAFSRLSVNACGC